MSQTTYTLEALAKHLNVSVHGDGNVEIKGIATLEKATEGEISFLFNSRYRKYLKACKASAIILTKADVEFCDTNALVTDNPYYTYAMAAHLFQKKVRLATSGIHETTIIGKNAHIAESAHIGANTVIGENVTIHAGVVIGPNCVIQDDVVVGENTRIWPNVTLCHDITLGKECEIHSGVVIGSDGFGFAQYGSSWQKIPQLGSVVVGDRVEIGANTTVDRGSLSDTVIEDGVKLDNQVQIAHNVRVGQDTVIAGCAGIAGSTSIGKRCQIGGGAGITGHISICDDVGIGGWSGISKTITKPGHYVSHGMGQQTFRDWLRSAAQMSNIGKLIERVADLEEALQQQRVKDKSKTS